MRFAILALSLAAFTTGCYAYGYRRPGIDDAVITSNPEAYAAPQQQAPQAPTPPPATAAEVRIVGAQNPLARGLPDQEMIVQFGPDQDGTQLLVDFLADARARGAVSASDVNLVFVKAQGGKSVECRLGIQPEGDYARIPLPAGATLVPVGAPVTQEVTENERRCDAMTLPSQNMGVTSEYKCSYAAVQGAFQRNYVCRVVPVTRLSNDKNVRTHCRTEPVTRTVTRYDFEFSARFVPPQLEQVQDKKLVETQPVCYAPPATPNAPALGNRLEAKLHFKK
jgi:hypothetical protein